MPKLNAVKDPKNGVVSCWVCTGVLVFVDVMRLIMLQMNNKVADWVFILLIVIWVIISVYQTIKYVRTKNGDKLRR